MARFNVFLISVFCISACSALAKLKERTDENGVSWVGPIRKCYNGSAEVITECIRQIKLDLTSKVGGGIEEIGLQPLDPILIKKFSYERGVGPVNVSLVAKDTVLNGLVNYNKLDFIADPKNQRVYFTYEAPYVRLETKYKLGGRVFFFPLRGSGPAQIEVFNLKAEGLFQGKVVLNDEGEEIVQVDKTVFTRMSVGDMNLRIRGLFDGNALLSSVVHYIGKRYAPEVFEIVRPDIEQFAGQVLSHDLLNPIFKQIPYVVEYVKKPY